jgi:hypothetical protein
MPMAVTSFFLSHRHCDISHHHKKGEYSTRRYLERERVRGVEERVGGNIT